MKNKIKKNVLHKLKNQKIILFGAGKVAEDFYVEHKDLLQISHCVSNLKREWGEGAFLGELDVKKYNKEDIKDGEYLIVCGPIAFRSIETQLEKDDLVMYEDYVESSIASAILKEKKIALFYGQCILRDIYGCIIQIPAFESEYASIFTQTVTGQTVVMNRLLYYAKDVCDLYVYTPKILDRDSMYSLHADELPLDCKIISISNLVVPLYWPQVSPKLDKYSDYYLYPYSIKRDAIFGHTLYRREDINIDRMVLEGLSTKEIVERVSDEKFYSEKEVIKNKDIFFKSVAMAEKGVDITIRDYMEETYSTVLLYQNLVHPTKDVIWQYVKRLLNMLNLHQDNIKELMDILDNPAHQGGDVPIYPSVAKHLKLDFYDAHQKYEIMCGDGIVLMTFKEYIEHFTEYTRKAVAIHQML